MWYFLVVLCDKLIKELFLGIPLLFLCLFEQNKIFVEIGFAADAFHVVDL